MTILFSDRGLPLGVRHINGYGSHTCSMINAKNSKNFTVRHLYVIGDRMKRKGGRNLE